MNKLICILCMATIVASCAAAESRTAPREDLTQYVDPFIGNSDNGHTFPGACVPFGMIQAGPESGNCEWRYCSGFNYDDDRILGFAQNHLNGTGIPDLGDVLLFPFNDKLSERFRSPYDRETHTASPGYYSVKLTDTGILAEMTATQRTAMHRYTFDEAAAGMKLLVDLQSGLVGNNTLHSRVMEAEVEFPDDYTITGHNHVRGWVERHFYFIVRFDRPYRIDEVLEPVEGEKAKRLVLSFEPSEGPEVQVKVAISTVDRDGATASLDRENPAWDFTAVREEARTKWNELLAVARIEGTQDQKVNFYTSLYHLFIQPNDIADLDGRYRGPDDKVHTAPSGTYYSTLSLWDTYRAAHPLYTIIAPDRVDGMLNSMLEHSLTYGYLPIWALWGKENYCMIGNHAVPVIVDACLKGFTGFDAEEAYRQIKRSLTENHRNSDWTVYDRYGYYPFDLVRVESVSRTLESAYDDHCAALMAASLGHDEDHRFFSARSGYYKNLFDQQTKMMRPRDSDSNWRDPFNVFALSHAGSHGGDYTEGNAWQYTWHVQHDVEGLIGLFGSRERFTEKLDSLFFIESPEAVNVVDVTGLIGQYAHGNEPSHHVVYMYNHAGQPHKTQELVREIFDRFYLAGPDGLCGNDDCGQMSAWYVFSAMGFYPVDPCGGEYILGAPQIPEITLNLPDSKTFTVRAEGISKDNKYVAGVTLDGKKIEGFRIHHRDIMAGGELVFTMTDKPS